MELNKLVWYSKSYKVLDVNKLTSIPTNPSGVLFDDGTYIQCGFGFHIQAYTLGAWLYEMKRDNLILLQEMLPKDGIINIDDLELRLSTFKQIKEDGDALIGNPTFIGAKATDYEVHDIFKDLALKWIESNIKSIWGVRCLIYMTEEDFWLENTKKEWVRLFKNNIGIALPPIKALKTFDLNIASERQLSFPAYLESLDARLYEVYERYGSIRELAGLPAYFGSSWDENFYLQDVDYYLDLTM